MEHSNMNKPLWLAISLVFLSSLSYGGSRGSYISPNGSYYFSVSGVGGLTNSNNMSRSYANLPDGTMVPPLSNSRLSYSTGGISAAIGHQQSLFQILDLQNDVQYLYLSGQNRQTAPLFNTNFYDSAFLNNVNVQTVTFNVGLSRLLFPRLSIYGDAGLGVALLSVYGAYVTNADILPLLQSKTNDETRLAWQAGGGLRYDLMRDLRLNGGVHYANLGNVTYGSFAQTAALPGGVSLKNNQFSALLLSLGIDYSFKM